MKTSSCRLFFFVALLFVISGSLLCAPNEVSSFKGKVYHLAKGSRSLEKWMDDARQESLKIEKEKDYFTGYSYLSRHEIHHGDCEETQPYTVYVKNGKIKRKKSRTFKKEESFTTRDGNEVVGLMFLHQAGSGKIIDAEMIDLDNTYEFDDVPLFWAGRAETDESLAFLEKIFGSVESDIQEHLVFFLSSHDSPQTYGLLRKIAQSDYMIKVREQAIFWLGSFKDSRSLEDLREIYKKETRTKLKEQIVFAYQMSDQPEAVAELIGVAQNEPDRDVRKNAVFWLGQKASEESVRALEEVVEGSVEDEIKKSAVFAISQLPRDKSVPMLIDLAKTNRSPTVRKNALFWLGQIDDERALELFEEILLKK